MLVIADEVAKQMQEARIEFVYPQREVGKIPTAGGMNEPVSTDAAVLLQLLKLHVVDPPMNSLPAGDHSWIKLEFVPIVVAIRSIANVFRREHTVAAQFWHHFYCVETGAEAVDNSQHLVLGVLKNPVLFLQLDPMLVFVVIRLVIGNVVASVHKTGMRPLVYLGVSISRTP